MSVYVKRINSRMRCCLFSLAFPVAKITYNSPESPRPSTRQRTDFCNSCVDGIVSATNRILTAHDLG
jgi:hypothetical protein